MLPDANHQKAASVRATTASPLADKVRKVLNVEGHQNAAFGRSQGQNLRVWETLKIWALIQGQDIVSLHSEPSADGPPAHVCV